MNAINLFLILTILSAICAWWMSKENEKQSNRIEQLGSINKNLTTEVQKLTLLNNSIALQNGELTKQNIDLSNQTNDLITEVQKLTTASNNLIKKVDVRTENESAQSALSGEILFDKVNPFQDDDNFDVHLGKSIVSTSAADLKKNGYVSMLLFDNKPLYHMEIIDGKIKFGIELYDLYGNWIADIDNNVWTRNPNNTGRFNYDETGFEVLDNMGLTVFSIELLKNGDVSVRGYFLKRYGRTIAIVNEQGLGFFSTNNLPLGEIKERIENAKIKRLFKYSGKHWLGVRATTP